MIDLERAIAIAREAHGGQTDTDGEDYISRLLRMMRSVSGPEEKIVALLHDILNDSTWTTSGLLKARFSNTVVSAVDALTHRENERYSDYLERAGRHPIARVVKIAKLRENLSEVKQLPGTEYQVRNERYCRALKKLGAEL